ncbi:phage major capsid protein [Nocardia carnea]|uniref:phage major capsid protein n=1 Tax=Nocardia carnea TaxID=37328 RepID=UPI002453CF3D|nr:phage major capsid protein [Nocardia carnea]
MTIKDKNGRVLSIDAMKNEREEIRGQLEDMLTRAGGPEMLGDDATEFDRLTDRSVLLREEIEAATERIENVKLSISSGELEGRLLPATGPAKPKPEDDPEQAPRFSSGPTNTRGDVYTRAMRQLDRSVKHEVIPSRGAEIVEGLMTQGPQQSQNWTQRWSAVAGSDAYARAFAKLVNDPERGHLTWTAQESEAYRQAAAVQHDRDMTIGTDSKGGHLVPQHLDPAIMLTNAGSQNDIRSLARVVTIATSEWNGVTSAGASAEWVAEATEVADGSPTLAPAPISVHKYDVFVPFSVELEDDGAQFLSELKNVMQDAVLNHLNLAYTTGSGSGQPSGFVTALAGGSSVVAGAGEALDASDPYDVQNALPARFQANASWAGHLATLNTLRQMETTNGALKFPGLHNNPPNLLGRKVTELSYMDSTINPAATEANHVLAYGDWKQGFVIVDRVGASVELIPHLMGASRRPTLQRGVILWGRTGSDVVVDNAFRLLNIATSAA